MRKSNWIILCILLAASIIFLSLWYALGFDVVDKPFDLVLTIVWWAVVAASCIAIHLFEKRRQESIRTAFLAPGVIFNFEAGLIHLAPGESYIDALRKLLVNLDYNFDKADAPQDNRTHFNYIVESKKFEDNGRIWEGEFLRVAKPGSPEYFNNPNELAELLAECPVK